MILTVKGKEYNIRFGYRIMAKTELLKDISELQDIATSDADETLQISKLPDVVNLNSQLVLAGLQKNHEEFRVNYDDNNSVKEGLEKVYDFMDDYMEDPESKPVIELFSDMVDELIENGFLSKKSLKMEKAATELDATVIPMDHKKG